MTAKTKNTGWNDKTNILAKTKTKKTHGKQKKKHNDKRGTIGAKASTGTMTARPCRKPAPSLILMKMPGKLGYNASTLMKKPGKYVDGAESSPYQLFITATTLSRAYCGDLRRN